MIKHIVPFIFLIGIIIGIFSITSLINKYRKFPVIQIKFYISILIFFNLGLLIDFILTYFFINIFENLSFIQTKIILLTDRFLGSIILYFFYLGNIFFIKSLQNKIVSGKFKKSYTIVWTLLMIVFFLGIGSIFDETSSPIPSIINLMINILGQILVFCLLIEQLLYIKKFKNLNKKKLFYIFLSIFFTIISLMLLLEFLALIKVIEFHTMVFFSSIPCILFNLSPLFFIYFLMEYFKTDNSSVNSNIIKEKDFLSIAKSYNITKREVEIIQLIFKGKSNKEISDILYISLQSVKDHNCRIFKKVNVKNRVQLINSFLK